MCVCGLAPLLGCRPIRVRVSCESIYCTPSPMQYNKHSTFQYGIRGLGFPRFPPTAASSSQRPSRRPPASAPPSPGGPQSAGPDPPLAWARTSASVPLLRAGVAAACPPPPARALFPRRNRPRSSAAAAFFPGHGAGSSLNVAPSSALARRHPWCASAQALFPWRNWPQSRSRGLLPRRLPPPVVGQCLAHLRQVPERAGRGGLGDGVTRPADLDERDSAVVPDDRARDADRRCSVAAFFSRPTALPDTASRTSGGRTPSDTRRSHPSGRSRRAGRRRRARRPRARRGQAVQRGRVFFTPHGAAGHRQPDERRQDAFRHKQRLGGGARPRDLAHGRGGLLPDRGRRRREQLHQCGDAGAAERHQHAPLVPAQRPPAFLRILRAAAPHAQCPRPFCARGAHRLHHRAGHLTDRADTK
jgi:hypothetical protein